MKFCCPLLPRGRDETPPRPRSPPAWGLVSSPSACRSNGRREGCLVSPFWFSFQGLGLSAVACRRVVVVVGATAGRINLSQLYSHTGGILHGGVSELMVSCACRSFRSVVWSSRHSSDLARSVFWRVAGVCRFCGGAGGQGEVGALERGCWSGGGGSIVIPRLQRWDAVVLDPRKHGDVPRSTCHNDMCLAACSGPVHRLTKPHWRWCFFGSGNGGGSASLPTCVLTVLECGGGH
jgi:hypothetical protein